MKNIYVLFLLTAVLAACTDKSLLEQDTKTYTITVSATKSDGVSTKALSLQGKTLKATWTKDDVVRVYRVIGEGSEEMESTNPVGTLTAQTSGTTTTLKGSFIATYTPTKGEKLRLKFLSANYENQKGTLEYIAANCDYAIADVTVCEVKTDGEVTTTAASFENQQAIVKFSLKKSDGSMPIAATSLTVKYGTSTYDVNLDDPASDIFVALPQKSNKDITLIAISADGNFGYEKSGMTFNKGKYYAIGVKMAPWTLSKALSDVTASEIGWRIGSDGIAYEPSGNLPSGVTVMAMIGFISSRGHGLAIELNGNPSVTTWYDAVATALAEKPTIKEATWRLPSYDDWFNIITGCAVEGDQTSFPSSGYSGLSPIYGFQQKWLATGFPLPTTSSGWNLWTSTETTSSSAYFVHLRFDMSAIALFSEANKSSNHHVLACLAF